MPIDWRIKVRVAKLKIVVCTHKLTDYIISHVMSVMSRTMKVNLICVTIGFFSHYYHLRKNSTYFLFFEPDTFWTATASLLYTGFILDCHSVVIYILHITVYSRVDSLLLGMIERSRLPTVDTIEPVTLPAYNEQIRSSTNMHSLLRRGEY